MGEGIKNPLRGRSMIPDATELERIANRAPTRDGGEPAAVPAPEQAEGPGKAPRKSNKDRMDSRVPVSAYVTGRMRDRLDQASLEHEMTRSAYIIQACREKLERDGF